MTPEVQTILALVLVALAAGWLLGRVLARRKSPGCSDDCGCSGGGRAAARREAASGKR